MSGGTPCLGSTPSWGVPMSRGYPMSGGDPMSRGYPISGGYPMSRGVPHVWGVPHLWPPITQSSIVNTCYVVVGVPLVFTQEDFLVIIVIIGKCFSDVSGFASYHVALGIYQTPWVYMVMCYYSNIMDISFLRIYVVPRIADL